MWTRSAVAALGGGLPCQSSSISWSAVTGRFGRMARSARSSRGFVPRTCTGVPS